MMFHVKKVHADEQSSELRLECDFIYGYISNTDMLKFFYMYILIHIFEYVSRLFVELKTTTC